MTVVARIRCVYCGIACSDGRATPGRFGFVQPSRPVTCRNHRDLPRNDPHYSEQ